MQQINTHGCQDQLFKANFTKCTITARSFALAVAAILSVCFWGDCAPAKADDLLDNTFGVSKSQAKHNHRTNKKRELADNLDNTADSGTKESQAAVQSIAATTVPEAVVERNKLISPPGEDPYFPVRTDGQPFVLNIDQTVNLTRAINQFYWKPSIEGEVWTPADQPELIERASRLMSTWPEYDSANVYRVLTGVNKFFEKFSGYGP